MDFSERWYLYSQSVVFSEPHSLASVKRMRGSVSVSGLYSSAWLSFFSSPTGERANLGSTLNLSYITVWHNMACCTEWWRRCRLVHLAVHLSVATQYLRRCSYFSYKSRIISMLHSGILTTIHSTGANGCLFTCCRLAWRLLLSFIQNGMFTVVLF